jgi:hypothetical protein
MEEKDFRGDDTKDTELVDDDGEVLIDDDKNAISDGEL